MESLRAPVKAIGLGLMLVLLVFSGCGGSEEPVTEVARSPEAVPVRIMRLTSRSFTSYLAVTGEVRARNHIDITVEEGGTLKEVLIDMGSRARKGQVLARLENKVLAATYRQVEAALKQAELDYESRKIPFESKAISENEYRRFEYALEAARASFELVKARMEKLQIVAPMDGLVNRRYYDLGAYINPLTRLFEFIDDGVMRIEAGLAERYLGYIRLGTPVTIGFDAYQDMSINGTVSYVSRSIDPDNRTFLIEIAVPNPGGRLAQQMVANLKIRLESYENRIVVPLDSMIQSEVGWHVFLERSGYAKRVAVTRLAIDEDRVLVNGLEENQNLIVVGQQTLNDGDPVQVISSSGQITGAKVDEDNQPLPGS
jgi:membrane fusion protein (multidrug efflux system)